MKVFSGFSSFLLVLIALICSISITPVSLTAIQPDITIPYVDVSRFPTVRAIFQLNDSTGKFVQAQKNDFQIVDNNVTADSTLTVNCLDSGIVSINHNILLVLDQSSSMNIADSTGEKRWDWVKNGATRFINKFDLSNENHIGLETFAKQPYFRCRFTQDRKELLDSLNHINCSGGTLYEPAFLDYTKGAVSLFKQFTPDTIKRTIVFLTDGNSETITNAASIARSLLLEGIQMYVIFLSMAGEPNLENVATETGGLYFSAYTKDELAGIFQFIAYSIQQNVMQCYLEWLAPYSCLQAGSNRKADITYKPLNKTLNLSYKIPGDKYADINLSQNMVFFDSPPPNSTTFRYLTLTSKYLTVAVDSITIQPNDFFDISSWDTSGIGTNPPFTIDSGSSRTIQIRYKQGPLTIDRTAVLSINKTQCPANVSLFSIKKPIDKLLVTYPNGGEKLSICDDIIIRWTGINDTVWVNLSYSTNNGSTWNPIANYVKGLSYKWPPPVTSSSFLIKAQTYPFDSLTIDVSNSVFSVEKPIMTSGINNLNLSTVKVGITFDTLLYKTVCNTGNVPLELSGAFISGPDASNYDIRNVINGIILQPGACLEMELSFFPTSPGLKSAMITITSCTGGIVSFTINGTGTDVKQPVAQNSIKGIKLEVFPNPASNSLNVIANHISSDDYGSIIQLKIFTIMGVEMKAFEVTTGEDFKIPVNNFSSGLYFITAEANSIVSKVGVNTSSIVPFVIQR